MRIGVFGGSFDPIHTGHLSLATCCAEQAQLDRVLLTPTAQQPLKPGGAVAPATDRLAMVEAAIAGHERLEASTVEIDRGGASYTVDTLAALAAELGGGEQSADEDSRTELFLLLGADALADIPRWRDPAGILQLATPVAVARAGEPAIDWSVLAPYVSAERLAVFAGQGVAMPPAPISSTELRRRIAAGEPWQEFVPPAVAAYIERRGLYGGGGGRGLMIDD